MKTINVSKFATENDTLVSIIVPTHNRAYVIRQCIDSILNQTYKNFELIIVDDHSEDNTIELLNTIDDSRLKIIKLKDKKGAQAARNEGIKNASGSWICFNDSDDFWLPEKMETQVQLMEKLNWSADVVLYSDCYVHNEITGNKFIWNLPDISFSSSFKSLLETPAPMFQSLFIKKDLVFDMGMLDEATMSYQEWDISLRLAKAGAKFMHIKKPLFIYNVHKGPTISKSIVRDFNGYQYIINKYYEDIIRYGNIPFWENHILVQYKKIVERIIYEEKWLSDSLTVENVKNIFGEIERLFIYKKQCFLVRVFKKFVRILEKYLCKVMSIIYYGFRCNLFKVK